MAIIHRDFLKLTRQPDEQSFPTFEHIEVRFQTGGEDMRVCVLYRPPSVSVVEFLKDFSLYLDGQATSSGHLLVVGDFNIRVDLERDVHVQEFHNLIDSMNMKQHIQESTHKKSHTLDLVLTREDEAHKVTDFLITPWFLLDHYSIEFKFLFRKPHIKKMNIKCRNIKNINMDKLIDDVRNSELILRPPSDLDELVLCYNNNLSSIFNGHAPVTEKEVVLRPHAPWYNEHIRQAKRERRRTERVFRHTNLEIDKQIFLSNQKLVNDLCSKAKQSYYNDKITEAQKDSKELFKISKQLLCKSKSSNLPSHSCCKDLANRFSNFFSEKIGKIRSDLERVITNISSDEKYVNMNVLTSNTDRMRSFANITEDELAKIILSGNSKSCLLDPMPTSFVKSLLPVLLPTIHTIVNRSLQESYMPSALKGAIVKPLLKKPSLDKENFKNYRPVSNLAYLGKLIESVAIKQIDKHLSALGLHEPLQSAYTQNHSTETAMIKVVNDILCALDRGQCAYLVLLDLSAAFDTIDHQVFLKLLREDYSVTDGVADWMESYLTDRHQIVDINGTFSDKIALNYGFPQGSKIGPFGFKLYTKRLTAIAQKHNISIHLYADDTQLYTTFNPNSSLNAIERMEACIAEVRLWMAKHFLKLNDSKTEFIMFGTDTNVAKITARTVSVGDSEVEPSGAVRDIGVMLDSALTMRPHVNKIVKSCYYQIRSLSKIRKYLTEDSAKSLTHAFVTSRLDGMNSLLYKVPDCLTHKLQLIQHNAARLILKKKKSCHITPLLIDLHWLPVKFRIEYKILLLVYKCLHGEGPLYLASLLKEYHPARSLRSSDKLLLVEPKTKRGYGDRAFSVAGPKLWNALDIDVKRKDSVDAFKVALKTDLFLKAFNSKDC